jgi:hypothetical protein
VLLAPFVLGSTCLTPDRPLPDLQLPAGLDRPMTDHEEDRVVGLVERRCMVCHGCYDAPCQLVLSSREGLWRGASKETVYRSARIRAAQPTRLGIDAQTTREWRELGFFSVTETPEGMPASLVLGMLALGQTHDFAADEPLPDDVDLALDRTLSCPKPEEFADYASEHPLGGMPYGMTSLTEEEYGVLGTWAASDAPVPPPRPLPDDLAAEMALWEELLNRTSLKNRVVARYVYEHWVFAHLYFSSHPEGPFFEVVRSTTPPGEPIDVIATRFPYDDPGVDRFWYRMRRIDHSIVHKTHITYELGPERRERYREIFLEEPWEPTGFPSWEPEKASNPFIAFVEIPSRARYRFLLDDAEYFVRTFIRGPVCRGQAATDVIQDRFFVSFLDPDWDISVANPSFLPKVKDHLRLPAEAGPNLPLFASWAKYDLGQKEYRDARAEEYRKMLAGRGTMLEMIWDGDGDNRNAMLTVFRNFDNAMVVQGWVGAVPKTAWIMDYPLFERIYYDLVAGFDVFGNVGHQLGVRFYMDNLRMESEDLFLAFLPEAAREPLRADWYKGATRQIKYTLVNQMRSQGIPTEIPYATDDPKAELIRMLLERNPEVSGPPDTLNRCDSAPCDRPDATALARVAERELQRLADAQGTFAQHMPEIALLRVRGEGGAFAVYTLLHDTAHENVAAIFREEARLRPEEDRITVMRGIRGSYPNFAFDVPIGDLQAFVDAVLSQQTEADLTAIASRWGIRRTSPRFWTTMDWMHDELIRENRREAGILDLARYQNW